MPRQAFNRRADIIGGPGSGSPGSVLATVDCRLVAQTGITIIGSDAPVRVAWITLKDAVPVGAWGHPAAGFKPSIADQIAIPPGSPPQWWVLYVEEVLWGSRPLYYRANVAYLPLLPDPVEEPCDWHGSPGSPNGDPVILIGDAGSLVCPPGMDILIGDESGM